MVLVLCIGVGLFSFTVLYKKGQEQAGNYISKKIKSEVQKQKDIQLKWKDLFISFVPLKLEVTKVKLFFVNNSSFTKPLTVEHILIEPDYKALLRGDLSAKVTLQSANIKNQATKKQATNKKRKKVGPAFSMEDLKVIPISRLILKNIEWDVFLDNNRFSVQQLNADVYLSPTKVNGQVVLSAKELLMGEVFFPTVQIKGDIKNEQLFLKQFDIKKESRWHIDLKQSQVFLKKPYAFKAGVGLKDTQITPLFEAFGVKNAPLSSKVNGKWQCKGTLYLKQNIQCEGSAEFNQFVTYTYSNREEVLNIPKLNTQSQIRFENNILKANTLVKSGDYSQLNVKSEVNEQGYFSAQYEGKVDFSDIKNLVSLDPKGVAQITNGKIVAKKDKLNIQAEVDIEQLKISQFILGNVKTQLSYTDIGVLRFRKIKGQLKKSLYTGNLNIHLFKNTIQLFAHLPRVTLQDVKYALKNRVYFPFEISGSGALSAYLNGPLKINALNYNLQAQFFKLKWEKEFFKQAIIRVESKNGNFKTKTAELLKNNGKINFVGEINSQGQMIAKLIGQGLYLQESENISRVIGPETTGIVDFDMGLKGFFLNPLTTAKIKVKNSFYRGYPMKDSHIDLRIRKQGIEAKGFLADRLTVQKLVFPYEENGNVELQAITNNLNIKELFLSKDATTPLYNQFQSSINGEVRLSYKKGKLLNSVTGDVDVKQLTIQANSYQLTNKQPFSLTLQKGKIQTDPILLQAGTEPLNIIQQDQNNIRLSGRTKLDFFIFLFPFMRIWEGDLNVDLNVPARLDRLYPVGRLTLRKGVIQLNPNIDPFEEVQLGMQIKNKKMLFKSIQSKIGGGDLQAHGNIDFSKKGKVPVNVRGFFSRVQFSSLPGIYARGSGQAFLTGKNFPYTLGLTANIQNSKIEKEFVSEESEQVQISSSLSLFEEEKENFEPIRMRLNLYFKNPIQIENSTMKSSFAGTVKMTGSPLSPRLSGNLSAVPGGTLIFRDHQFDIASAEVVYAKNKASNPAIDLKATTFVKEANDANQKSLRPNYTSNNRLHNEYNIRLRVQGRGENPKFQLSSTPSMTEKEIASLLAFGTRSITFESGSTTFEAGNNNKRGSAINNIAKYSYYHLGPTIFQKVIGQELKDTLGVDQFLIVPHINSKDNSTVTKVIVRKKMFNRLHFSASQTLLDKYPERDVKAEYNINKNISLIGQWQNNEDPPERSNIQPNILGLNVEYQVDF